MGSQQDLQLRARPWLFGPAHHDFARVLHQPEQRPVVKCSVALLFGLYHDDGECRRNEERRCGPDHQYGQHREERLQLDHYADLLTL